ncbi:ribonuclease J [bacterium]|nr:ribonuclease J [bacterium]
MNQTDSLRWMSIGGVGEIGKNCYALDIQGKLLLIDVGMSFPDAHSFGIDIVIPDFTHIVKNQHRLKGILLTHGHEDHIGALTYLLQDLKSPPPIYGSRFTLALLRRKLSEFAIDNVKLIEFTPGDDFEVSGIQVATIRVTHSIPDSCSIAVKTPQGWYLHSGDFKFDPSPVDGKLTDFAKLERIGREGVMALSIDVTNIEQPGHSKSETSIFENLDNYVAMHDGRVLITTFASNIHRLQQAIDVAVRQGRKVLVVGRTMVDNVQTCQDMGYMKVPPNTLINPNDIDSVKPNKLMVLLTGSQGEAMAAMARIANQEHRFIHVMENDLFIFSARPIPGNEIAIFSVIDDLFRQGAEVIYGTSTGVHVSGHGYQDEIQRYVQMADADYLLPTHGYFRHQMRFKKLAMHWGYDEENIIISELGKIYAIHPGQWELDGTFKAGEVYIAGEGADVSRRILNERLALAEDGLLLFNVVLSADGSEVISGPELMGRGFLQPSQAPDLFERIEEGIVNSIHRNKMRSPEYRLQLTNNVQNVIQKIIFQQTRINPVVIGMVAYAENAEAKVRG